MKALERISEYAEGNAYTYTSYTAENSESNIPKKEENDLKTNSITHNMHVGGFQGFK